MMPRWLYTHAIALRHAFGWFGLKILWERRGQGIGQTVWLRWHGGLRWGEIKWRQRHGETL
jgi:hypothetical protein